MKTDNGQDGLRTIHKLIFTLDSESLNPADNKYVVENDKIFVVNVSSFMTMVRFEADQYHEYDLREPTSKVVFPERESTLKTHISPEEWKYIPHNPAADERVMMIQQHRTMGQNHIQSQYAQRPFQPPPTPTTLFSPQYARMIGAKPRATISANIGLGGVRR
jgi:hypothetical protein